jgi:antitoxin ParD1/3/4
MDIALDPQSQAFVDDIVRAGRFATPAEAVGEGLRLLQDRERRLQELRASVQQAIERGGALSEEELDAALEETFHRLEREGL